MSFLDTLLHVVAASVLLTAFPMITVYVVCYFLQRRKGDA